MRIHTSLPMQAVLDAGTIAHVQFNKLSQHGSRSHDHAFEVTLFGSSNFYTNPGTGGRNWTYDGHFIHDGHAATWDEWGIFLGHLFQADPAIKCRAYDGAKDFHFKTNWRFDYDEGGLDWDDQHRNHQWEYAAPMVNTCKGKHCTARRSWGPVAA